MSNLAEIIRQIQRDLSCPVCGKKYEIGEIRLKGLFDRTLVVQTVCANGHITLLMTRIKDSGKKEPISTNDIIDLHNALEDFDGNFQKLWSK